MAKPTYLIVAAPEVASGLKARLEAAGCDVVLAVTSAAIQEGIARTRIAAAVVDVKASSESAHKILAFLRKALPGETPLFVSERFLPPAAVAGLLATNVRPLTAPLSDPARAAKLILAAQAPKTAARHDANVINCFVTSVNTVLEYYTQAIPELGKATVVPHKRVPAGFVSAVVSMDGDNCEGSASLSCEEDFIIDVASRVNGTNAGKSRLALVETTTELADQIFGKTELLLGKLGFAFTLGSPEVHISEGAELVLRGAAPAMVIPFSVRRKRFFIGFSLALKVQP